MRKIINKFKNIFLNFHKILPHKLKTKELYELNTRYTLYLKLQKKYSKFINKDIKCENLVSNYVFVCWLQGEENAPILVKKCIETIKEQFKDKKVVVISNENLKDYTNFPDHILLKWKNGIITNTHFSDLLRVELLSKYGGLWLDATVFCTGNLDKYIDDTTDLFAFRNEHRHDLSICLSSWLIYAKANHPIIINTRNLLYKYWEKNNNLKDYFLFHIIFTICANQLKNDWEKVPYFTNLDPHVLWFHSFYEPFDQNRFNKIKEMSNFHKLSFKFDSEKLSDDSFYEHFIKDDYE